jgi:hypothetical protein
MIRDVFGGRAPAYMFATRPTETMNAIMTAVRDAVVPGGGGPVQVFKIGVSSFSSGIGAMRLFSFRNVINFRSLEPHAQIGWMMFYTASLRSAIS